MYRLLEILKRIDFQKLAGIGRILGVDLTGDMIRIVELEKKGGWLNRYASTLKSLNAFTCRFDSGATENEKVAQTRELIRSHEITATYAVGSVRTHGVKTVVASIPATVDRIDEWIKENFESLLRLPLSTREVAYDFEIIESTEHVTRVEITFVRNSDVEQYVSFFQKIGLTLIALGAGTRDAINGFVIDGLPVKDEGVSLAFVDLPVLSVTHLTNGKRDDIRQVSLHDDADVPGAMAKLQSEKPYTASTFIIAGSVGDEFRGGNYALAGPFGLGAEYVLAAGLGVKGFFPQTSPVNVLPGNELDQASRQMYTSLRNRVVLALGSILILLLGLEFVASSLIQSKLDSVQGQLASSGPEYAALALLQRDVEGLERKLSDATSSRTSVAKTLHNIAGATPGNVWLHKLQLSSERGGKQRICLFGYSTSNDGVAVFLKQLQQICSDVDLVRSSVPLQSETFLPASTGKIPFMTFEIMAVGKD